MDKKESAPHLWEIMNCSNLCGQYKKRSYEDNI